MSEAMNQGAVLMLLGMGIVFCFLSLLVVALGLMSKLLASEQASAEPTAVANPSAPIAPTDLNDPELLSAITAAVHSFRAKRDSNSNNSK